MNNRLPGVAHLTSCIIILPVALAACGGGSGSSSTASVAAAAVGAEAASASPGVQALAVKSTSDGAGDILAVEGGQFTLDTPQVVQYGAGDRWVSRSASGAVACTSDFFGSDPNVGVVKSCVPAAAVSRSLADEGGKFSVSGVQVVQYGAGSTWMTKSLSGSGSCSNDFFGSDPVPNVVKSCRLAVATVVALAAEGQTFKVSGSQVIQYGAVDKWLTRSVTGEVVCSNAFFGTDPLPNVGKSCKLATTATLPFPLTVEGKSFSVAGTQVVQYGAGTQWTTKSVTGTGTCSNGFFAQDPAVGTAKSCQLAAAAPTFAGIVPEETSTTLSTLAATAALMPTIDLTKIAKAEVGYATERVAAANVVDPSQNPNLSDIGSFREYCEFSHMSYDDPIVSPGVAGSHLHTFMGNTGTNRNSTALSIATAGNSTCSGGTLNRTSYWFPSMIDTKDGTPLRPMGSLIYYKQGYHYVTSASIKPFPAGLRMVAGNSASSGIQDGIASFTCFRTDGTGTTTKAIPTDCPAGSRLTAGLTFPQCWDGVNLDSPDHKSHMAYATNGCPSTHPVPLTEISFQINYAVTDADGTSRWRLSSDSYDKSLPGGYSSHADWFDGWNPAILAIWTSRCINASMDCHAFLIGDGRILF